MAWLTNGEHEPHPEFLRNPAGRPVIPTEKLHLRFVEEAPDDKKLLAINWAKEWLGIPGGIDREQALAELGTALSGRRRDNDSDEGRILRMARQALCHWRDAANHERTRSAFPWLKFIAVEGEPNCPESIALNGRLIADEDQPLLPMPSCNAPVCSCMCLRVSEGKRQRMIKSGEICSG